MAVWLCIQASLPRISLLNQVSNLKSRFPDRSRSRRELPITLPRGLVNLSLETFSLQKTNQPGGLGKVASYIRYHVCSRITNLIAKLFRHASKAYLRFVQKPLATRSTPRRTSHRRPSCYAIGALGLGHQERTFAVTKLSQLVGTHRSSSRLEHHRILRVL